MRELKQVLGWNMVALAVYTAIFYFLLLTKLTDSITSGFLMMVTVGLHAAACLLASLVFHYIGKKEFCAAFLLTTLAAGLVGFSVCYSGFYVMG